MDRIQHFTKRFFFLATLSAIVLGTSACGPDCDGLCNDAADACARFAACQNPPPGLTAEFDAICNIDDAGECLQFCTPLDGGQKSTTQELIDAAQAALAGVGC